MEPDGGQCEKKEFVCVSVCVCMTESLYSINQQNNVNQLQQKNKT